VVKVQTRSEDSQESDSCEFLEFRLGEKHGHRRSDAPEALGAGFLPWFPPAEADRVDIAPWVTVAILALSAEGSSAEFEPAEGASDVATGGLSGRCSLTLLQLLPTSDLLVDDGMILRTLDLGHSGPKPRDLSKVTASWRVWFVRNSEMVMSTFGEGGDAGGIQFVLDEGQLMVALQLALKDMHVGSRACLRISEEWAQGALLPSGSPVLRGAAVWVELCLIDAINEPAPREHGSVSDALAFALQKKERGNTSIVLKDTADWGRAIRRYEAGIQTLEATLPGAASGRCGFNGASSSGGVRGRTSCRPRCPISSQTQCSPGRAQATPLESRRCILWRSPCPRPG